MQRPWDHVPTARARMPGDHWRQVVDLPGRELMLGGTGVRRREQQEQGVLAVPVELEAEVAELRARGVEFEEYDQPGLCTVEGIAST